MCVVLWQNLAQFSRSVWFFGYYLGYCLSIVFGWQGGLGQVRLGFLYSLMH